METELTTAAPALPALFDIEHVLAELTEIDEDAIPTEEALAAYRADLELAIRASVEKRERIAWRLFDLGQRAAVKRAAAKVHTEKASTLLKSATSFDAAADRLRAYVVGVMKTLPRPKKGPRTLEGETATFTAKGVPPSVEIFDDFVVPAKWKYVTVRVPMETWQLAMRNLAEIKDAVARSTRAELDKCPTTVSIADKSELKEALLKTVKCRHCNDGISKTEGGGPCAECEGAGTKRVTIPGVRLIDDKLRLEVS